MQQNVFPVFLLKSNVLLLTAQKEKKKSYNTNHLGQKQKNLCSKMLLSYYLSVLQEAYRLHKDCAREDKIEEFCILVSNYVTG